MTRIPFLVLCLGLALASGGIITVVVETAQWILGGVWSPVLVWEVLGHFVNWQPRSVSDSDVALAFYAILDWRLDRTMIGFGLPVVGVALFLLR